MFSVQIQFCTKYTSFPTAIALSPIWNANDLVRSSGVQEFIPLLQRQGKYLARLGRLLTKSTQDTCLDDMVRYLSICFNWILIEVSRWHRINISVQFSVLSVDVIVSIYTTLSWVNWPWQGFRLFLLYKFGQLLIGIAAGSLGARITIPSSCCLTPTVFWPSSVETRNEL